MSPNTCKWFITDLCDTLYRSNTTFEFARFVAKRRGRTWSAYERLIGSRTSPLFYMLAAAWRASKVDLPKRLILKVFSGLSVALLDEWADDFVNDKLSSLKIEPAWEELRRASQQGLRVAIISASISPVVSAVARVAGADFASSELALDPASGLTTGLIHLDLTGSKHLHLEKLKINPKDIACVMTDNMTDYELMSIGRRRIAVVHTPAAMALWSPLNPDYIRVSF